MTLETRRLHPRVGVEVLGVDVTQIAFSRRFGPLETSLRTITSLAKVAPEVSNLANVDAEDRLIPAGDKSNLFNAGNQMWHTDSSFKPVPALASLLSAREVPPAGGETEFASTRVDRGRPWDESAYRRVMHRTTVAGDGPTVPEVPDTPVAPAREVDIAWGRAQLAAV
jgi:alpha-ketoglutarate-dependent taurine dioxygenase